MNEADKNGALNCAEARFNFALLLYGELSFDEEERVDAHLDGCADCRRELERQRSLHAAIDSIEVAPSPALLRECRAELRLAVQRDSSLQRSSQPLDPAGAARIGWWDQLINLLTGASILRPAGAMALVLIGFLGARLVPYLNESIMGGNQAGIARVSDVETQGDGKVRIVVDETRQKTITGSLDDQQVRTLLLVAARDPNNPGLRTDSVDLLSRRAQSAEIRGVLVYLLGHDKNDGVRLKAMEGLRQYVAEPEVRSALSRALLSDANPGVRTQAIDLLIQGPDNSLPNIDRAMIGTLQELMLREKNASLREHCERLLEAVNASAEMY